MRLVVADASSLILLAKSSVLRAYGQRVTLLAPRPVLEEAAALGLRERWREKVEREKVPAS